MYKLLRDDIAAMMEPAAARALDALLVAEADDDARRAAAELAVHHPVQAARLLCAYQTARGNDIAEEQAWDALIDARERCLVWHGHGGTPA